MHQQARLLGRVTCPSYAVKGQVCHHARISPSERHGPQSMHLCSRTQDFTEMPGCKQPNSLMAHESHTSNAGTACPSSLPVDKKRMCRGCRTSVPAGTTTTTTSRASAPLSTPKGPPRVAACRPCKATGSIGAPSSIIIATTTTRHNCPTMQHQAVVQEWS